MTLVASAPGMTVCLGGLKDKEGKDKSRTITRLLQASGFNK